MKKKIFLLLFMFSLSVKADRSILFNHTYPESWISNRNFETMIKLSFPYAQCCNIFADGSTPGIDKLFNHFIKIYPYDYLVKRLIYACDAYFLLAAEEERIIVALQRVPSQISTTEILIILDNSLINDSEIFNVSLYQNSNVNLVSHSGIWSLSENFLEPRRFYKIERYDEMAHKKGVVNLEGRHLQAASFFNPPLCYLNHTINQTINGIEAEVFLADNDFERDGIEMQIFMLIAKKLNFRWTMRKPEGNYRYGRKVNDTAWDGGMIGQIFRKEIDIAFSGIWLKHDHYLFANLSEPWNELSINFLVPRPKPYSSFWAILRPFPEEVWFMIILMLIIQTIYTIIRARINPKVPQHFRNVLVTITELIGQLVGTWIPESHPETRVQMLIWQTSGFVLVTAYSTILAARLANPEYEERIDTAQQFVEANLTWGRQGPTPLHRDYFDLSDKYFSQLPGRFYHEESTKDRHNKILNGNYAIVGRFVGSLFFPEDNVTNEDLKNYRLMSETAGTLYSSFAVQPWLLEPVNTVMLWLKEGGITLYHLKDVIRRRASPSLFEVLVEHDFPDDGVARVLELTPLGAAFSFLILGLLMSTLVFYFELRSARGSRSMLDVFKDINQKKYKKNITKLKMKNIRKIVFYDNNVLPNKNLLTLKQ